MSVCGAGVGGGKMGCCWLNEMKLGENIDKLTSIWGVYCFFVCRQYCGRLGVSFALYRAAE